MDIKTLDILDRLVIARKNAGLTQVQAGKLLGVTDRTMSNYETGRTKLLVSIFLEMCEAYEVDICWALTGKHLQQGDNS